eukprot:scaffold26345_cov70-Phaeocystis_antarctica.AAC.3
MHSAAQEVAEALGLSVAADPRAGSALDGRCARGMTMGGSARRGIRARHAPRAAHLGRRS